MAMEQFRSSQRLVLTWGRCLVPYSVRLVLQEFAGAHQPLKATMGATQKAK